MVKGQGRYVKVSSTTTPRELKKNIGILHQNKKNTLSFAYTTKYLLSNINYKKYSNVAMEPCCHVN